MTHGVAILGAGLLIVLAVIAILLLALLLNIVYIRECQQTRTEIEWQRHQKEHPQEVSK